MFEIILQLHAHKKVLVAPTTVVTLTHNVWVPKLMTPSW